MTHRVPVPAMHSDTSDKQEEMKKYRKLCRRRQTYTTARIPIARSCSLREFEVQAAFVPVNHKIHVPKNADLELYPSLSS
jgi:hypothetical protein